MCQPTFHVDLCDILGKGFNTIPKDLRRGPGSSFSTDPWYGCGYPENERGVQQVQLYMCPREDKNTCNKPNQYCANWDCETIAPWKNTDPFLTLPVLVNPLVSPKENVILLFSL